MVKIGIGCTTYNRPECLAKWKEQFAKHTFDFNRVGNLLYGQQLMNPKNKDYVIHWHISDDSIERKGVAFRKNECLRSLKDCDYVFLFDDDCYPIKDGWIEFFVESKQKHLLFLNDSHIKTHTIRWNENDKWNLAFAYKECGGVLMFMTKDIIQKVGAFNEEFELWGFEHAEYSQRIASLTYPKSKPYVCLDGTDQYIYSEDYSNPTHKSSITNEEKNLLFKKNFPIFAKGIESIYIPL